MAGSRRPNERVEMKALRLEPGKQTKLTPRERLLDAINRARFDARLAMIRLKNNKSRYFRNAAVVATAAGAIGAGVGLASLSSKPTTQPQRARVERVNYVPKDSSRNQIYTSERTEQKVAVKKPMNERELQLKRYEEQRRLEQEQRVKEEELQLSFVKDPNTTLKKINAIKDPELRERYLYVVSNAATNIENFESVYNKLTNKRYKQELLLEFADGFVGAADGGFQHAYDIKNILEIKNINLRQSVFERILYGSGKANESSVLNTLHHQDEYDALIRVAKTLPNAKKYILDLQKQKRNQGRNWDP